MKGADTMTVKTRGNQIDEEKEFEDDHKENKEDYNWPNVLSDIFSTACGTVLVLAFFYLFYVKC